MEADIMIYKKKSGLVDGDDFFKSQGKTKSLLELEANTIAKFFSKCPLNDMCFMRSMYAKSNGIIRCFRYIVDHNVHTPYVKGFVGHNRLIDGEPGEKFSMLTFKATNTSLYVCCPNYEHQNHEEIFGVHSEQICYYKDVEMLMFALTEEAKKEELDQQKKLDDLLEVGENRAHPELIKQIYLEKKKSFRSLLFIFLRFRFSKRIRVSFLTKSNSKASVLVEFPEVTSEKLFSSWRNWRLLFKSPFKRRLQN